jgi:hypothetical protein
MKLIIALCILGLSSFAFAKDVCMSIPDNVTFDSAQTNFDGSITYSVPRVAVQGTMMKVSVEEGHLGICKLMQKAFVGYTYKFRKLSHR